MAQISQDSSTRFHSGDYGALKEVVAVYQEPLFRIGLKLLGNPDDAKDFCQDVFLHAWKQREFYNPERPFQPWFFQLAFNLGRGMLRKRKRVVPEEYAEPQSVDETAHASVVVGERSLRVQALLQQLKPMYRECLALRFESDLKLEEIAEVLGVSTGTVKTRLRRGLMAFKELYIRNGGEE